MPTDWITTEQQVEALGRVGNYADGSYIVPCLDCDAHFEGHKEARQCLPCAVKALQARLEEANKPRWIIQFYDEDDGTPLTYTVEAPDGMKAVEAAFDQRVKEIELEEPDEIDELAENLEVIRVWRGHITGDCQARDIFPKGRLRVSRFLSATP